MYKNFNWRNPYREMKAADRNSWTRVASCARIFCGYGCILISSSIWETPSGDVSKRPVHSHSKKIKKDFHPDMYLWRLRKYTSDTCMLKIKSCLWKTKQCSEYHCRRKRELPGGGETRLLSAFSPLSSHLFLGDEYANDRQVPGKDDLSKI